MNYRFFFIIAVIMVLASCKTTKTSVKRGKTAPKKDLSIYEQKLGIPLPSGINQNYIANIADWVGAPYKYGGNTTKGTDCSGFVQSVYLKTFNLIVDHNSLTLFKKARSIKMGDLKEGDLLFFKIDGNKVSHVGMFITGDYFIHASTKRGVVVSRKTESYYQNAFAGYGTLR